MYYIIWEYEVGGYLKGDPPFAFSPALERYKIVFRLSITPGFAKSGV